jgi:two-component system, OmpR family, sensor kinase
VARRLLPAGLRAQLALAIALITALALALSFLAVYRGTGSDLRNRIDEDLRTQAAEWEQLRAGRDLTSPSQVENAARAFIAAQRYHPASRIFVVDVAGGTPVSNEPRILEREIEREEEDKREEHNEASGGDGVIKAAQGLSTARVQEAGKMRVLTRPIVDAGRRVGTLQIADPLGTVENTQQSLLGGFVLVGLLALVLAVAAGVLLATLIARPLRRMASVAAAVDAGDLSLRAGATQSRSEVGVLASAFDRMLDRLERAFARQRDFVSDASHELRTPLAVLRAQVELLDRESDERRRHDGAATLLRRLDEMDRLISDMLTLASAEAGRLVEPQDIDLADFFEDLRRDLPLFGERDFHLRAVAGVLHADPDRLTQVLRNLVRNAVSHTEPADRVEVVAKAANGRLTVSVADGGPGIAPEHLERIFERFYRVDESRSRDAGGSGLGLAIARAIVEAHGGRIWADSQPGHGTTITLQLPGYRAVPR